MNDIQKIGGLVLSGFKVQEIKLIKDQYIRKEVFRAIGGFFLLIVIIFCKSFPYFIVLQDLMNLTSIESLFFRKIFLNIGSK